MSVSYPQLALDEQLCFALHSTMLAMNKVYRKVLKPLGLTYSQYLVMLVLWQQDQQSVSQIGERLFLDSATLTPLLKRMESRQLLRRERSNKDERQVIVTLTESGRQLQHQAAGIPKTVGCATHCDTGQVISLRNQLTELRQALMNADL